MFAIFELAASIPDDFLLQKDDDKEEVEISETIRHGSVGVDIVEKFEQCRTVSCVSHSQYLHQLSDKNENEDVGKE